MPSPSKSNAGAFVPWRFRRLGQLPQEQFGTPTNGWLSIRIVRTRAAARYKTMGRLFPIPPLRFTPEPPAVYLQAVNRSSVY